MANQHAARLPALLGSAIFLVIAPGTVAVYLPWTMTRWTVQDPRLDLIPLRVAGVLLALAGLAGLLDSFRRFAVEGLGTPAPVYPTRTLVATRLYRYVRNPMYCGVVAGIAGQALIFGSPRLFAYGLALWLAFHLFVHFYEEPRLRATYGDSYEQFRRGVPRW